MISEHRKKLNKPSSGLTSTEDIQMRMVTRFVNETALCLQHEIIASPVVGGKLGWRVSEIPYKPTIMS